MLNRVDPDRRALGPRHLPGRQLPGRLVRVERPLPRHDAQLRQGDAGQLADLGWRLTGSADLYGDDGRSAYNSVNFVTCHDGFTLHDLVSYNGKHNERNGENNRDGANDNHSWNCGVEGETDDPARPRAAQAADQELRLPSAVLVRHADDPGRRRIRCARSAATTTPTARTTRSAGSTGIGAARNGDLVEFFRKAIALTRRFPILQRRKFFLGQRSRRRRGARSDLVRRPTSAARTGTTPSAHALLPARRQRGRRPTLGDYLLFFILNAHHESRWVTLPPPAHRRALVPRSSTRACPPARTSPIPGRRSARPGRSLHREPAQHRGAARPIDILTPMSRR